MTSQEKKEFLSRYLEILAEEKDIREEIAYWESKAQKVTASWSAVPSGGKGSDKVQTGAIKVAELRESLMDIHTGLFLLRPTESLPEFLASTVAIIQSRKSLA